MSQNINGIRRGIHEVLKRDEVVGTRATLVRRPKKNVVADSTHQPKNEKKKKEKSLEDEGCAEKENASETEEGEISPESEGEETSPSPSATTNYSISSDSSSRRRAISHETYGATLRSGRRTPQYPSRITSTTTKIARPMKKFATPKETQKSHSHRKKHKSKKITERVVILKETVLNQEIITKIPTLSSKAPLLIFTPTIRKTRAKTGHVRIKKRKL